MEVEILKILGDALGREDIGAGQQVRHSLQFRCQRLR
jgi:hypothetical protein